MELGPMKVTFSKFAQHPDHKRKTDGPNGPLESLPQPKRVETPQPQVSGIMTNVPPENVPVNEIRMASNNGVIENAFQGIESQGPIKPGIEDRYLVFVIGCVVVYLYATHAPDRFRFIST